MAAALSLGVMTNIAQNVPFSLPPKVVYIQSSAAIESSADGTVWTALTGANTVGAVCVGNFIRCPGGAANVICKSY